MKFKYSSEVGTRKSELGNVTGAQDPLPLAAQGEPPFDVRCLLPGIGISAAHGDIPQTNTDVDAIFRDSFVVSVISKFIRPSGVRVA